jgi:hypothetical protein
MGGMGGRLHNFTASAFTRSPAKPDTSRLQETVVNRLMLMGKRIGPGDRKAEAGIEFLGDAGSMGLQSKAEQIYVSVIAIAGTDGATFPVSSRSGKAGLRAGRDDE